MAKNRIIGIESHKIHLIYNNYIEKLSEFGYFFITLH